MEVAKQATGAAAADPLARERAFLQANVEDLAARYPGRYLLIQGERVYGAFETFNAGVDAGLDRFPTSDFLVRSVLEPDDPPPLNIPALSLGFPLVADPQQSR